MIPKRMFCSLTLTALSILLLSIVLLPVCGVHAEEKPLTVSFAGAAELQPGQSAELLKTKINSTESGCVTYTLTDTARNAVVYSETKTGLQAGDEIAWKVAYDSEKLTAGKPVKCMRAAFEMDGKKYAFSLYYNYSAKTKAVTVEKASWYYGNTACSFGIAFRDIRPALTEKWYTFTPLDLTLQGRQTFEYVASNMYVIGEVYVDVWGDTVTVSYRNFFGDNRNCNTRTKSEYFTFFHDLGSVTEVEPENLGDAGFRFGVPLSIEKDLGGDTRVLLFIRNVVDYSTYPLEREKLTRFWPNLPERVQLRNAMQAMMD